MQLRHYGVHRRLRNHHGWGGKLERTRTLEVVWEREQGKENKRLSGKEK